MKAFNHDSHMQSEEKRNIHEAHKRVNIKTDEKNFQENVRITSHDKVENNYNSESGF